MMFDDHWMQALQSVIGKLQDMQALSAILGKSGLIVHRDASGAVAFVRVGVRILPIAATQSLPRTIPPSPPSVQQAGTDPDDRGEHVTEHGAAGEAVQHLG